MDESVIKFYRQLLRQDFPNSGAIEAPSIFIEAVGEKLINCGNTGNYMQVFLRVTNGQITEIKYLCSCAPVANVAVEILCILMKGLTLQEALELSDEPFYQTLGSRESEFVQKVQGLLQLVAEGIKDFESPRNLGAALTEQTKTKTPKISWDK